MKAIIVSDLHIGTRYFRAQHFDNFLKSLPKGYDLAFNGDVPNEIDESFVPFLIDMGNEILSKCGYKIQETHKTADDAQDIEYINEKSNRSSSKLNSQLS